MLPDSISNISSIRKKSDSNFINPDELNDIVKLEKATKEIPMMSLFFVFLNQVISWT